MTEEKLRQIRAGEQFIREHLGQDAHQLSLRYASQAELRPLIEQIAWRAKIVRKLPEWYAEAAVVLPNALSTEQASSAETARLKATLIKGEHLLDITGGLGVDAYYLSPSFQRTTYVEQAAGLALCASHNYKHLGADIRVVQGDGRVELAQSDADWIYVDPYRRDEERQRVISLQNSTPDVTQLLDQLLQPGRRALIKTSPMLDIRQALLELRQVSEVWVISLRNDCKEVVYLLNQQAAGEALLRCFNITPGGQQYFEAALQEQAAGCDLARPQAYLYEANSAIMKAGLHDALARRLRLAKLHPHSHFYTSDRCLKDFPGRVFALEKQCKPYDKSLKKGRYNVISRNFPAKASEIEQKLRIKSSKDHFLLATRLQDDSLSFLIARQI